MKTLTIMRFKKNATYNGEFVQIIKICQNGEGVMFEIGNAFGDGTRYVIEATRACPGIECILQSGFITVNKDHLVQTTDLKT